MERITDILKKPIVKIASLNGVSVVVRIMGGLITSKVMAEFIGAAGFAVIGSLRNFLTYAESFSTLGMQNGIIKYTAENEKDEQKLHSILATVFISLLGAIIIVSLALLALSEYLSQWVFQDYNKVYTWVFKVLAFSLPWYTGSLIFMAVLNGLGRYKQVIWLNISGNILGVLLSALLMWKFHTNGALLGLILFQALFFFISFYSIWRRFPGFTFLKLKHFDFSLLRGLLSYSLMTLVTVLSAPLIYMSIRSELVRKYSLETAGHWDAMSRLSSFYIMFASTMLTVYFLPKLSVAQTHAETKRIFLNYYKSMLPLFAVGLLVIYVLRKFIIRLLFKEEFMPMEELFLWQLLGDFLKVGSLILGFQFFAKKLTRAFIISEIISLIILYFSSMYFIELFGARGAVMGHAATYFLYWAVLAVYFRKQLF